LLGVVLGFAKARKVKLYIVGGYLRDMLLKRKRESPDIDFCLKKGAISFGRALSKKIKAGFVVLDKAHGAARLVKKIKDKTYTLDFTDFRGRTLAEDLRHRDFTINTLSRELGSDLLLDLYNARGDLRDKIIRQVNAHSFDEDPLRILRAFSFSSMLGFKIDQQTLRSIAAKKKKLSGVSPERIRDELFKIFDSPCASECLSRMDKLKILKVVFPEFEVMRGVDQGPYHHLDVHKHSFETLRQLELLFEDLKKNREIQDYLDEVISSQRRRRALMKLGALLHDIGKPQARRRKKGKTIFHGHERIGAKITEDLSRRLKLSNDEVLALKKMVFWHLRPGYLADNVNLTARAKFRYFRDTQDEAASTLLISLADQRSTKGRLTTKASRMRHEKMVSALLQEYFQQQKEKKEPRLVTGDDLIREFKLEPSPLIGAMLREVEELQAIGKIQNRQQALQAAKKFMRQKK